MVVGWNKFSGRPRTNWVELPVLEPRLDKRSRSLCGLSYQSKNLGEIPLAEYVTDPPHI